MSFGDRLREARKKAGMSQEQLALELGITQGAIGRYELTGGEPDIEKLVKISKLLGVSLDWIMGAEDININQFFKNRATISGMALINKLSGLIEEGNLTDRQIGLLNEMVNEFCSYKQQTARDV